MKKLVTLKVAKCDLEERKADPRDFVKRRIFVVRGQRVMLDRDLAALYGVTTKQLNQQLKRNRKRFPEDFAFQLTLAEAKEVVPLRSQNVTLKRGQHIKHPPHVFTEHGAIMLASVLNSPTAVQASVYVVRAFVEMRAALTEYAELSRRIDELAATYDHRFQQVFEAIRDLMAIPSRPQRRIGFVSASLRGRKVAEEKWRKKSGGSMNINRRVLFSLLLARPTPSALLRVAVLETFETNHACAALLVHHAEPAERDMFAAWLQAHSKSLVRVRSKTGDEVPATIFRVRMCFGRGLILLQGPMQVRERDVLTLVN